MQTDSRPVPRPRHPLAVRALLVLCALGAAVALAACGSSGSTNSTRSASASKAGGAGASRFAALRSCLQRQGITLPSRSAGSARPQGGPGAGAPGGGFQLPKGVSQSQFQEALKKCGGRNFAGPRRGSLNSATARAALTKYAACLRENGVNVRAPNTNGNGPVFDTKGIDTSSSKFKAAQSKCQSNLKGVFPATAGGAGGKPQAGAPGGSAPSGRPPTGAPPAGASEGAPPGEGATG